MNEITPSHGDVTPPRVVVRQQPERAAVQLHGMVERELLVRELRRRDQVGQGSFRFSRFLPVVGEHPREVPGSVSGHVLDVSGDGGVAPFAIGARERRVGHLTDQDVLERELRLAPHLAGRFASDQISRLEGIQRLVHSLEVPEPMKHSGPEVLADDRRGQDRGARLRR